MSKAIVNPDELRRFATFLNIMTEYVMSRKSSLNNSFANLNEVWRDQKYAQFQRLFTETMASIDQFCRHAEVYAQYLRRKAELADRYLERRY